MKTPPPFTKESANLAKKYLDLLGLKVFQKVIVEFEKLQHFEQTQNIALRISNPMPLQRVFSKKINHTIF